MTRAIPDLMKLFPDLTERQLRHWLQQDWCIDVERKHVGGRIGYQWVWGNSGWAHVCEMARLTTELHMNPPEASNVAATLLLTGVYVTPSYTLTPTGSP